MTLFSLAMFYFILQTQKPVPSSVRHHLHPLIIIKIKKIQKTASQWRLPSWSCRDHMAVMSCDLYKAAFSDSSTCETSWWNAPFFWNQMITCEIIIYYFSLQDSSIVENVVLVWMGRQNRMEEKMFTNFLWFNIKKPFTYYKYNLDL